MKTRPVQRTRLVPHTVNGKTEMVLDRYTVDLPVPPRDWDHTVLTAVTATGLVAGTEVVQIREDGTGHSVGVFPEEISHR